MNKLAYKKMFNDFLEEIIAEKNSKCTLVFEPLVSGSIIFDEFNDDSNIYIKPIPNKFSGERESLYIKYLDNRNSDSNVVLNEIKKIYYIVTNFNNYETFIPKFYKIDYKYNDDTRFIYFEIYMEASDADLTYYQFDLNNFEIIFKIIEQMNNCIKFLHNNNIAHHDIKLENFVYKNYIDNPIPKIKIIDFGCSTLEPVHEPICSTDHYRIYGGKFFKEYDIWTLGICLLYIFIILKLDQYQEPNVFFNPTLPIKQPIYTNDTKNIEYFLKNTEPHFFHADFLTMNRRFIDYLLNIDNYNIETDEQNEIVTNTIYLTEIIKVILIKPIDDYNWTEQELKQIPTIDKIIETFSLFYGGNKYKKKYLKYKKKYLNLLKFKTKN